MSNDNYDMDEDMEEESQKSLAWVGMNLREQIKGKFGCRGCHFRHRWLQIANARLIHPAVPRQNLEIYVSEGDEFRGLARYDAFLMVVAEGPNGQSVTRNVLEHTRNEERLISPAQALYRLFVLTAIEVNIVLLRDGF